MEDKEHSHRGGRGWRPGEGRRREVVGKSNWTMVTSSTSSTSSPTYTNLVTPYSSLAPHYSNVAPQWPPRDGEGGGRPPRSLPPPPTRRERSMGSSLTLGEWGKAELGRVERKRRAAVMACKSLCFLLLLASFILVIVAVSVFLSNGRNHFGPM